MPAEQLSAVVMRTYGQACRQAAERAQQIVSELVGADSSTVQLMRAAVPPDPEDDQETGAYDDPDADEPPFGDTP